VNFDAILTRLKSLGAAFSTAQLLSLVTAFVVVVGVIVGAAWWLNTSSYRVLFAELDPEAAGRVTQRLQEQKVPFEIAEGGRAILVPEERIDQLRLDFAVNGLPTTGRMGFEIFDATQFGATEFLEQVNFRRALEGEIARTISTIAEVASARVHISLAKDRLFGEQQETAKASVVLKLRSNRPPSPPTIQGISSLVAAAVEGLRPEAVVIMDTNGRSLANPSPDDNEPMGAAQTERQQQYEQQLSKQLVALLEPVVGAGGVRANVAVRLHQESEERVEEKWDPDTVIRSQSTTMEGAGGAVNTQGIAGARANLPGPVPPNSNDPAPPTLAQASTSTPITNPSRMSETKNFEIGKQVIRSERPRGGVARLSVAVLVDDERYVEKDKDGRSVPKTRTRTAEQVKKLHELVTMAVGLDTTRGDQLTVQNIAFNEQPPEELEQPSVLQRYGTQVNQGLKVVVILILGVAAFFLVGRPMMRRPVVDAQPVDDAGLPKQLPKTIEQVEGELAAQLEAATNLDRRLPVLTRRLTGLTQKDPEIAARLVRTWLVEDRK
jgi:flagellar M-ring protein FliF